MPRPNKVFTEEIARQIAEQLIVKAVTAKELLEIARGYGLKNPYPRLIIEGLEAKGWLVYEEGTCDQKNTYGVMNYKNGRSEYVI